MWLLFDVCRKSSYPICLMCVDGPVFCMLPNVLSFPLSQLPETERHRGQRDSCAFVRPAADWEEICPEGQRSGGTGKTVVQAGPPVRLPDCGEGKAAAAGVTGRMTGFSKLGKNVANVDHCVTVRLCTELTIRMEYWIHAARHKWPPQKYEIVRLTGTKNKQVLGVLWYLGHYLNLWMYRFIFRHSCSHLAFQKIIFYIFRSK